MKTYLEQYFDMVQRGEILVSDYLSRELENQMNDLNNPAYIYDPTHAHKRIAFQQKLCLQSKAPYYGKPIALMPWQLAWWEALYSFYMKDTGLRRYTEALLLVARKNGKSTMFAADGNTDLFIGKGGSDICCASNDDRQARLIWTEIAGMRSRLDPHKIITGQNLTEIKNRKKNICRQPHRFSIGKAEACRLLAADDGHHFPGRKLGAGNGVGVGVAAVGKVPALGADGGIGNIADFHHIPECAVVRNAGAGKQHLADSQG